MKKNKGITLIALIITIVVMLILVAVSVNVIIKGNLIGIANKTVNKYKTASEEEGDLNGLKINGRDLSSYIPLPEIKAGERATEKSNYNGVTIPEGFTVSGIPGEQDKNKGLVIYDIPADVDLTKENFWTETTTVGDKQYPKVQCDYNQFVWVPVKTPIVTKSEIDEILINECDYTIEQTKNGLDWPAMIELADREIYPMAVKYGEEDSYRGSIYRFTSDSKSEEGFSVTPEYFGDIGFTNPTNREPDKLTGTDTKKVDLAKEEELDLQTEYNNIVKSVIKQKGFWIARYELSSTTTAEGVIKGESKRGKDVSSSTWYDLYSICGNVNLVSGKGVKSNMVYGSQYDQIMFWLKDVKNTTVTPTKSFVIESTNMGNLGTGAEKVSGYDNSYSTYGIFDLAGNLGEWTVTAASGSDARLIRGRNI